MMKCLRTTLNRSLNALFVGYRLCVRGGVALLLATFFAQSAWAQIALGQSRSYSTLGQPLSATVDIIASPQDLMTLRGRSYRVAPGGGIDASITTRIVSGPTGAMVELGSLTPINDPFIDVVVELVGASGASMARQFTLLINPSTGYAPPPVYAYSPSPTRARTKASTSATPTPKKDSPVAVSSANNVSNNWDDQLKAARKELAELEAKVALLKKAPEPAVTPQPLPPAIAAPSPLPSVSPEATAKNALSLPPTLNIPKPSEVLDNAVKQLSGKLDSAMGQLTAPSIAQTIPPSTAPTPSVVAPVASAQPAQPAQTTSPATNKPATLPPKPSAAPLAVAQKEQGLFGLDFLPSAQSLGLDSISSDMLMMLGGGLILIAAVVGLLIWRSRRALSPRKVAESEETINTDAIFGGVAEAFAAEQSAGAVAPAAEEIKEELPATEEAPKKKKSSFLNRFRKKKSEPLAEETSATVAEPEMPSVAPSVPFESTRPTAASAMQQSIVESRIERFSDDSAGGIDSNDFLGDLEQLTQAPATAMERSTMLLSPKEADHAPRVSAGVAPTHLPTSAMAPETDLEFSDQIQRINTRESTEESDNPVNTAFTEMLSEDISSAPPDIVRKTADRAPVTQSKKEEVSTEFSLDDLDFSSEKTMILPNLQNMVKESDGAAQDAGDFEFNVGTDSPKTAVPSIASDQPDFNKSAAQTASLVTQKETPSLSLTHSQPIEGGFDLPALDLPDVSTPTAPASSAPPTAPADLTFELDLPDLSNAAPAPKAPAAKPAAPNSAAPDKMFELPPLDLSSMKLG